MSVSLSMDQFYHNQTRFWMPSQQISGMNADSWDVFHGLYHAHTYYHVHAPPSDSDCVSWKLSPNSSFLYSHMTDLYPGMCYQVSSLNLGLFPSSKMGYCNYSNTGMIQLGKLLECIPPPPTPRPPFPAQVTCKAMEPQFNHPRINKSNIVHNLVEGTQYNYESIYCQLTGILLAMMHKTWRKVNKYLIFQCSWPDLRQR